MSSLIPGVLTPMVTTRHHPWRRPKIARLVHLPYAFLGNRNDLHFWRRPGIYPHCVTCKWEVHCGSGPTELFPKVLCHAFQVQNPPPNCMQMTADWDPLQQWTLGLHALSDLEASMTISGRNQITRYTKSEARVWGCIRTRKSNYRSGVWYVCFGNVAHRYFKSFNISVWSTSFPNQAESANIEGN